MEVKYDKKLGIVPDLDTIPEGVWQEMEASKLPTEVMVRELVKRGVIAEKNHYGHNVDVTTQPAYCQDCEIEIDV